MRDIFITGGTGLVGSAVIERLIARRDAVKLHVLIRSSASAALIAARTGADAGRIDFVIGDVTKRGLGLDPGAAARLSCVDTVIHSAADTTFSNPLETARAINTAGTRNMLELAAEWGASRFVQVSTAYVAGTMTGWIPEAEHDGAGGFVNAYEQSKLEAERLVRSSGVPFVVVRPSSIICDDVSGMVSQFNAVHRSLRVLHMGLGCMMPGTGSTPVDAVPNDRVAEAVTRAAFVEEAIGRTYQVCAGAGAMRLDELLERAHAIWSGDTEWRRRGILLPVLTDLETYRLFERSVHETGDVRLAMITRSLSHFVPQLALPKHFQTAHADELLGGPAPCVASFWDGVVSHVTESRWGAARRAA